MAFVYERISNEDIKKYQVGKYDKKSWQAPDISEWMIDRERDIYVRNVYNYCDRDDGGYTGIQDWVLYWGGELVEFQMQLVGTNRGAGEGENWVHWKLLSLPLSSNLENCRAQIIHDLKEAFAIRRKGNLRSINKNIVVKFDY